MEDFDRLLKAKFNVLTSENRKSVENKYPMYIVDIDF